MCAKSHQDTLYIINTEYNWGICEQEIEELHQKQEQARQQLERNQMQARKYIS